MSGALDLSVVIPAYDEAESLELLAAELKTVLEARGGSYEILFVDDGSRDGSAQILDEMQRADPHVVVFRLDRNHGISAALHCGFTRARGRVIVTLDADLQNDPADIPRLYAAVEGGVDMACGWRKVRHDPFVKRASSRIANAFRSRSTGDGIHDVTCPLKVFRREVVSIYYPFMGLHRFLPTLAKSAGFKVAEIPVNHRVRKHGSSKYGVWNRLFRGLRDLRAVKWMLDRRMTYVATRVGGASGGEACRSSSPS